jgi:hypothetical protein
MVRCKWLIFNHPYFSAKSIGMWSVWLLQAHGNRHMGWTVLATLLVLALVYGVPAVSRIFALVAPQGALLLVGLVVVGLCVAWIECIKWRRGARELAPGQFLP